MIGHNSGITLAGMINATKLKGTKLRDEKYLFHGAGSAGIGLACSAPRWSVKACRSRTPPDSLDFARAKSRPSMTIKVQTPPVLVLNWHTAVPGKFHPTGVAGVVIE
jgi:Malic enzyme, NAD binding domain